MRNKEAVLLCARYFVLLLIGLSGMSLFYTLFTPLTVYSVYGILSLTFESATLLANNVLFFDGVYAQIIPACIAGAAYYLLLILNLSTPMKEWTRFKSILFISVSFLLVNIVRIVVFAMILSEGYQYFDAAHSIVWHLGSTVIVAAIWFINVQLFKIGGVPVYSDMRNLLREARK